MSGSASDLVDVLLVEDDPGDALMATETLELARKNGRFHVVADGQSALRFLRRTGEYAAAPSPRLVLLDLNLPGLSGLEVLAEIKSDPELRIIPVIVLSSSRHPDDIRRSYAAHANAYVVKPVDFDGFADTIQKIDACFLGLIQPPV
ncbi:MAG: response regulator [Streptosporangiaceae bacterium]